MLLQQPLHLHDLVDHILLAGDWSLDKASPGVDRAATRLDKLHLLLLDLVLWRLFLRRVLCLRADRPMDLHRLRVVRVADRGAAWRNVRVVERIGDLGRTVTVLNFHQSRLLDGRIVWRLGRLVAAVRDVL